MLAVLLVCGASIVPLSLMMGKSAKDKLASAGYIDRSYGGDRGGGGGGGYHHDEPGSYLAEKFHQAKDSIFGHPSYTDEMRYRGGGHDDRSFTDKLLGRRSASKHANIDTDTTRTVHDEARAASQTCTLSHAFARGSSTSCAARMI
jgi:hypothetical protein